MAAMNMMQALRNCNFITDAQIRRAVLDGVVTVENKQLCIDDLIEPCTRFMSVGSKIKIGRHLSFVVKEISNHKIVVESL